MSRLDLDSRNEADRPAVGAPGLSGERWMALWADLDLPPVAPPPPGFAARVQARVRAERRAPLGLPLSPVWARAAIAAALVVGVAGGAGLGLVASSTSTSGAQDVLPGWSGASLAEDFVSNADSAVAGSDAKAGSTTTTDEAGEQP